MTTTPEALRRDLRDLLLDEAGRLRADLASDPDALVQDLAGLLQPVLDRGARALGATARAHLHAVEAACWLAGQPVAHERALAAGEEVRALVEISPLDPNAPAVRPSRYTAGVLPAGHSDAGLYEITVEELAADQWTVVHLRTHLDADGHWQREPPHDDGAWWEQHLFDLPTALALARRAAPQVALDGVTAGQVRAGHPGPR
ncbi:hypothetical protein [Streptacidiphilus sp. EB103A]|uniref:hypothetical protein n=1 Tax=Streptacidiphilus sp. EB103A TaxID=3156275 RepID=UPI00351198B9